MHASELRDNIYEHVSASSSAHPIKVFRKESIHCYVKEDEKRTALSNKSYAGLARVCHQIRHEYLRSKFPASFAMNMRRAVHV